MNKIGSAVAGFFRAIGNFFGEFFTAIAKGDWAVKLSLIIWGAGYARRKQYVKAIIMTALEVGLILFSVYFASQYVPKFGTLGTVQMAQEFNVETMQMEFNDFDNSFLILLSTACSRRPRPASTSTPSRRTAGSIWAISSTSPC